MSTESADHGPTPEVNTDEEEIVIGDRFRILPGSPLPEFDQPGTEAVSARDQLNPGDFLFARICEPNTMPRIGAMEHLRHMQEANVLRPLEWGLVDWPGTERRRFAVVFPRPEHSPLMSSYKSKIKPRTSDDISRRILAPAVLALGYFGSRGLTHRAIRPDNIYFAGQSRESVILGECVTAPPASQQPVIFETIEAAMTAPLGRGQGLLCDDFYALGVTILLLSMGECPVADLDDKTLIAAKVEKGSYSALMNGRRPPFGQRELLRGLLSDDPIDRWGIEELEQWLGGSLRRSVQQIPEKNADRPFLFNDVEYRNCRSLAHAFATRWEEAYTAIRSSAFDKWLRRGTSDPSLADQVTAAIQSDADGSARSGPSGRLVARVCMILDHAGPIRFKGLCTMPDGIGTALAAAFYKNDKKTIKLIGECISKGVVFDWFAAQPEHRQAALEPELLATKRVQQFLRNAGPGYGIERALYTLNPNLPCLSPVLRGKYVVSLRNLLPTLEQIVVERGELPGLVDRHLAAFIASHMNKNIDLLLAPLEDRKGGSMGAKLGMLTILTKLQGVTGPEAVPNITEWLAGELEPAISRFKSKSRRRQLIENLEHVAQGGDLAQLQQVVNNQDHLQRDEGERRIAMRELAAAAREIAGLQSKEFQDSARRTGWQIASAVSLTVAFSAMAVVTLW